MANTELGDGLSQVVSGAGSVHSTDRIQRNLLFTTAECKFSVIPNVDRYLDSIELLLQVAHIYH